MSSPLPEATQRRFRRRLQRELAERCSRNPRYSIRAFARWLRVDHSTIARLLRGARPVTAATLVRLEARLADGCLPNVADGASAPGPAAAESILSLVGRTGFRPDSRQLARTLGLTVDAVNCALFELIRTNRLVMVERRRWTVPPNE